MYQLTAICKCLPITSDLTHSGEGVSQRRKEKGEAAEKRVEELEAALEEAVKREKTKSSRVEQLEEKINILESIKFEAESQMEDDQAKMESLKVRLE